MIAVTGICAVSAGAVVSYYGVGFNGEGEGGIGVDVAVEFQFDGDFRVADALDV